ncbi:hypothetical protein FVE85_7848 [Porphyridium purpureum]|uniref:Uncharacterized protein n=1 Tax=Porphyridium purpureum TaxID=35688 RepID=A0A5J4YJE0_PORPP|nr:hypothetical protein FVE85_7848 [Porphyridium purpureum]|eukprot:POR7796..scf271_22
MLANVATTPIRLEHLHLVLNQDYSRGANVGMNGAENTAALSADADVGASAGVKATGALETHSFANMRTRLNHDSVLLLLQIARTLDKEDVTPRQRLAFVLRVIQRAREQLGRPNRHALRKNESTLITHVLAIARPCGENAARAVQAVQKVMAQHARLRSLRLSPLAYRGLIGHFSNCARPSLAVDAFYGALRAYGPDAGGALTFVSLIDALLRNELDDAAAIVWEMVRSPPFSECVLMDAALLDAGAHVLLCETSRKHAMAQTETERTKSSRARSKRIVEMQLFERQMNEQARWIGTKYRELGVPPRRHALAALTRACIDAGKLGAARAHLQWSARLGYELREVDLQAYMSACAVFNEPQQLLYLGLGSALRNERVPLLRDYTAELFAVVCNGQLDVRDAAACLHFLLSPPLLGIHRGVTDPLTRQYALYIGARASNAQLIRRLTADMHYVAIVRDMYESLHEKAVSSDDEGSDDAGENRLVASAHSFYGAKVISSLLALRLPPPRGFVHLPRQGTWTAVQASEGLGAQKHMSRESSPLLNEQLEFVLHEHETHPDAELLAAIAQSMLKTVRDEEGRRVGGQHEAQFMLDEWSVHAALRMARLMPDTPRDCARFRFLFGLRLLQAARLQGVEFNSFTLTHMLPLARSCNKVNVTEAIKHLIQRQAEQGQRLSPHAIAVDRLLSPIAYYGLISHYALCVRPELCLAAFYELLRVHGAGAAGADAFAGVMHGLLNSRNVRGAVRAWCAMRERSTPAFDRLVIDSHVLTAGARLCATASPQDFFETDSLAEHAQWIAHQHKVLALVPSCLTLHQLTVACIHASDFSQALSYMRAVLDAGHALQERQVQAFIRETANRGAQQYLLPLGKVLARRHGARDLAENKQTQLATDERQRLRLLRRFLEALYDAVCERQLHAHDAYVAARHVFESWIWGSMWDGTLLGAHTLAPEPLATRIDSEARMLDSVLASYMVFLAASAEDVPFALRVADACHAREPDLKANMLKAFAYAALIEQCLRERRVAAVLGLAFGGELDVDRGNNKESQVTLRHGSQQQRIDAYVSACVAASVILTCGRLGRMDLCGTVYAQLAPVSRTVSAATSYMLQLALTRPSRTRAAIRVFRKLHERHAWSLGEVTYSALGSVLLRGARMREIDAHEAAELLQYIEHFIDGERAEWANKGQDPFKLRAELEDALSRSSPGPHRADLEREWARVRRKSDTLNRLRAKVGRLRSLIRRGVRRKERATRNRET